MNIAIMRKKAGLTQQALAEALSVNIGTVGNWEREDTFPDADQIWNCAHILGCSPNDILGWKNETLSPDEVRIVEAFRAADSRGRENILLMAEHEANRGGK